MHFTPFLSPPRGWKPRPRVRRSLAKSSPNFHQSLLSDLSKFGERLFLKLRGRGTGENGQSSKRLKTLGKDRGREKMCKRVEVECGGGVKGGNVKYKNTIIWKFSAIFTIFLVLETWKTLSSRSFGGSEREIARWVKFLIFNSPKQVEQRELWSRTKRNARKTV